ncbi:iron-binding apoprotein IscA [Panacagrimonas perspica]|uniref:Iron-binding apoprotein IscA n=1 Tax=Panacagrimonas perspica TaxID=381431 RepID=A0A4R7PH92_9GAMM|nr:iron-sulfur cluster assembly accessory protein [Panacagrimonas perspica]TDU32790.1 iron-binding apoprotein IscA [Panacagrimonas perspica]THD02531.1 iron-sulfur cluster assembly protein IscA [Panacagrimonas perspica]
MSLQLSASAASRIQLQLAKRGKGLGLRVGVKKSGCSGYAYTMDYADDVSAGDEVFESHGAKLIVKSEHLPMLQGMILDWQKQGLNESFKFINPNVKAQCGCGESFAV